MRVGYSEFVFGECMLLSTVGSASSVFSLTIESWLESCAYMGSLDVMRRSGVEL